MKKRIVLAFIIIAAALAVIKRKDMTWRQSFLRAAYPLIMLKSKLFQDKQLVLTNTARVRPPHSFYDLTVLANDGTVVDCKRFAGKKVMIVNTASDCGYTGQYAELEKLHQEYPALVVLGFPANDFKEQEKGSDASIAQFCKVNFGVSFPLMQKTQVVKGDAQNEVFSWLSHKEKNGWCNQQPAWNFCKYVINETGELVAFFEQGVSPLDKRVVELVR